MELRDLAPESWADFFHYVILFAIIAATWLPIMDYFNASLPPTLFSSFVIFVVSDKLLHAWLEV